MSGKSKNSAGGSHTQAKASTRTAIRTVQGGELPQKLKRSSTTSSIILTSLRKLLNSGAILLVLLIGVLFRDIAYGEIFLLIYAAIAFVSRVSSETSFRMAFVMLLALPIVGVLNKHMLAQNFAVYGFLLLIIGVVSAFIEQISMNRSDSKVLKSVVKKA